MDHNFADAHYELGKAYLKLGVVKAGYGELMRTVELAPNNVPAHVDLGSLYELAEALSQQGVR